MTDILKDAKREATETRPAYVPRKHDVVRVLGHPPVTGEVAYVSRTLETARVRFRFGTVSLPWSALELVERSE